MSTITQFGIVTTTHYSPALTIVQRPNILYQNEQKWNITCATFVKIYQVNNYTSSCIYKHLNITHFTHDTEKTNFHFIQDSLQALPGIHKPWPQNILCLTPCHQCITLDTFIVRYQTLHVQLANRTVLINTWHTSDQPYQP